MILSNFKYRVAPKNDSISAHLMILGPWKQRRNSFEKLALQIYSFIIILIKFDPADSLTLLKICTFSTLESNFEII